MPKKILVVEDNPNIRDILDFTFTRKGYEVLLCKNGLEVADLLKTQVPDCFILDIMLPYKTGFEILEDIRRDHRFDQSVVIFLSAITQDTDKTPEDLTKEFKVNAFFQKPFKIRELAEAVDRFLAGKAAS